MTQKELLLQETLYQFGIKRTSKIYNVIFAAVMKVIDDPDMLYLVSKRLYMDLAKEMHSSYASVEISLRRSANQAWATNPDYLRKITRLDLETKPETREFIDFLAIYIERSCINDKMAVSV